jgi:glycosyltransferase involved in cell wall biosynthesis
LYLLRRLIRELKILFIHNDYYEPSGEEHALEGLAALLEENGHTVIWYRRSSNEFKGDRLEMVKAALFSIHNSSAIREIEKLIEAEKPDIVQVQSIYPFISPGILKAIKKRGIPLIMRCPNYRMWCPTGLFLDNQGNVCEKCLEPGRELWCVGKNCTGKPLKSAAYALRNFTARKSGVFLKYVDTFIVQSTFQQEKFISLGVPKNKIAILPGLTAAVTPSNEKFIPTYYSFIGRVSREKGVEDIFNAARSLSHLKFAVAGRIREGFDVSLAPPNVEFMGFLTGANLEKLYQESKAILVPSRWYEGFPNVITKAMFYSKPVIASNLGCFKDIIDHEENGLLVDLNDGSALENAIRRIEASPGFATEMGRKGKNKAEIKFGKSNIYSSLIKVYSELG